MFNLENIKFIGLCAGIYSLGTAASFLVII